MGPFKDPIISSFHMVSILWGGIPRIAQVTGAPVSQHMAFTKAEALKITLRC